MKSWKNISMYTNLITVLIVTTLFHWFNTHLDKLYIDQSFIDNIYCVISVGVCEVWLILGRNDQFRSYLLYIFTVNKERYQEILQMRRVFISLLWVERYFNDPHVHQLMLEFLMKLPKLNSFLSFKRYRSFIMYVIIISWTYCVM